MVLEKYRKTLCPVPPLLSPPHEIGKLSVVDEIWYKFRLFFYFFIITKI